MSLPRDAYALALAWLGAGLVADVLIWRLRPSAKRPWSWWVLGGAVSAVFCGLYFVALQATQGLQWNVHLWLGAILAAGASGLLTTWLLLPQPLSPQSAAGFGARES